MKNAADTRYYFAVPTHYTIGAEFESYAAAVAHARSTIRPHDGFPGFTRAFVDVRVSDPQGDRVLDRVEVFLLDPNDHVTTGPVYADADEFALGLGQIDGGGA